MTVLPWFSSGFLISKNEFTFGNIRLHYLSSVVLSSAILFFPRSSSALFELTGETDHFSGARSLFAVFLLP